MHRVILRAGDLEVRLAPRVGGGIARFSILEEGRPFHLLRPAPEDSDEVRHNGCFPLVPYSNRIRDGRFQFRGRTVRLSPNMQGQKHPLHGIGWRRPWSVATCEAARARLVFRHDPGEWPWAFEACQWFQLDPSGLSVTLSVRNLSDDPMPVGLGFHPYFPCDRRTVLDARAASVWITDSELIPAFRLPVQGRYVLTGRPVLEQALDNGYEGWDGEAAIGWGRFGLRIRSPAARFLQVFSPPPGAGLYTPDGWGVFAAEPVTHANAALNRPEAEWKDAGLEILESGQETVLAVRFDVIGGTSS